MITTDPNRHGAGCGSFGLGAIFAGVGFILAAIGFFYYLNLQGRMRTMETAEGVIVALHEESDGDGGTLTVPEVEFATAEGEVIRAVPFEQRSTSVGVDNYDVGDRVQVYYEPDNPNDMFINDFMHVWFVPALTGSIGGGFFLIGGLISLWGAFTGLRSLFSPRVPPSPPPTQPTPGMYI